MKHRFAKTTFALFLITVLCAFALQELKVVSLFNSRLSIKIPTNFQVMDDEMRNLKYRGQNIPTLVYTNEGGTINVAFNMTANKANQQAITPIKDAIINSFKKSFPTAEWKDSGIKDIHGKKFGYLELITPTVDTKVYNLIFFTDLEDKLLMCTFNCTIKEMKDWEPIAKEIFLSAKVNSVTTPAH